MSHSKKHWRNERRGRKHWLSSFRAPIEWVAAEELVKEYKHDPVKFVEKHIFSAGLAFGKSIESNITECTNNALIEANKDFWATHKHTCSTCSFLPCCELGAECSNNEYQYYRPRNDSLC